MNAPGGGRRVLFVDEDAGRSGSTVSMEFLLQGFRSAGYEVFVLTLKNDAVVRARLARHAAIIDVRGWKMSSLGLNLYFTNTVSFFSWRGAVAVMKEIVKSVVVLRIVLRTLRETRADLLYANEYVLVPAFVGAWLRRTPSVVHVRSPFIRGTFGVRRALISRLIPLCSGAVVAITPFEAAQLHPRKIDREKIHVVGEFVTGPGSGGSGTSVPELRENLAVPPESKVVTMLGGILSIKGTIDFLRAAGRVSSEYRDVMFIIAGRVFKEGIPGARAYYDECMKVAEGLQSGGHLRILGEIPDAGGLIAASDVLVSPSPETHFSRPVVEAWAHARPVVAVRTPHMNSLVTDGVDAFLVQAGDDSALAERLLMLLRDPALCERLGREGKKKAESAFDADRNVQEILRLCDHLIS